MISGPTFTITQPTEVELEVVTVDVTNLCNGDCEQGLVGNGAFFANTIGGTGVGTYTYTWIQFTNAGIPLVPPVTLAETGPSVTGLCAGLYSVTVTDADNCTDYNGSLEIVEPEEIDLTIDPLVTQNSCGNNISCVGGNDGEITVNNPGPGGIGRLGGPGGAPAFVIWHGRSFGHRTLGEGHGG